MDDFLELQIFFPFNNGIINGGLAEWHLAKDKIL